MDDRRTLEIFIPDRVVIECGMSILEQIKLVIQRYRDHIDRIEEYWDFMESGTHISIIPKTGHGREWETELFSALPTQAKAN